MPRRVGRAPRAIGGSRGRAASASGRGGRASGAAARGGRRRDASAAGPPRAVDASDDDAPGPADAFYDAGVGEEDDGMEDGKRFDVS